MGIDIKRIALLTYYYLKNRITKKSQKSIMFIPHVNCKSDNYDLLNGDSDNVLCLVNNLLRDCSYNDYTFYVGYYDRKKLEAYKEYCREFYPSRIHFFIADNLRERSRCLCKSSIIFTDETFMRDSIRVSSQKIICLNYYAGFMKNDFYRFTLHGGYNRMLQEQKDIHKYYDKLLSTSDICSMFLTVEDCMYYGDILPLGFPRNDVFFHNKEGLRDEILKLFNFDVEHIFTYVPTHRDYENEGREFYDKNSIKDRTIFGPVSENEIMMLEGILEQTKSIIIAKIHPAQARSVFNKGSNYKRIIFYHDIVKHITTSLNPILSISDFLITDYTTAVYDFMYTNRPIIYYFYDIEKYTGTRGLFIDPIEPICMGDICYSMQGLISSILSVIKGSDPFKYKREVISDLLIKYKDGLSTERIKSYFLK